MMMFFCSWLISGEPVRVVMVGDFLVKERQEKDYRRYTEQLGEIWVKTVLSCFLAVVFSSVWKKLYPLYK